MPKKRDQHFVPKFYLRKFSYQGNEKQIGVFDTITGFCCRAAPLKHQAYKKYLYGADGIIEEFLSKMEGSFASLLRKIENCEFDYSNYSNDITDLLVFVALSDLRNPIRAKGFRDSNTQIIEETIRLFPAHSEFFKQELRLEDPVQLALSKVSTAIKISEDLKLKILVNKTPIPFLTSDNPVVRYNQFLESKNYLRPLNGYGALGLQIFFPINTKLMVMFYDGLIYKAGNKSDFKVYINDVASINELNKLQFLNCERMVYFNEEFICTDLNKYIRSVKYFEKPNNVKVSLFPIKDKKGVESVDKIIANTYTDCRIKMQLQNIKITKGAKKQQIEIGKLQVRKLASAFLDLK